MGYISRDFLDDYTGYFVKCYENYDKVCKRIHFFSNEFTQNDFEKLEINNKTNLKGLFKDYKGCMVVKRIPYSIIGYTLLDTYPDKGKTKKNLYGTKEYNINLFGLNLPVKSLAYQEQDSVVSACATTAIWNVLSKAADNPRTLLKSPIEITTSAGNIDAVNGRMFPNKNGLSIEQMINALYEAKLVTEHKLGHNGNESNVEIKSEPFDNDYLKQLIYAYAPIGIPQILILKTYEKGLESGGSNKKKKNLKPTNGLHAVTIVGFKNSDNPNFLNNQLQVKKIDSKSIKKYFKSRYIERIYCHDDQFGPFVKCNLHWLVFSHQPNQESR
ncbi:MAG: hypothetical protein JNL95_15155 [Chitinophagales bacterium]|nr:hypothetical protein [Chitinophagales bacterium]